MALRTQEAKPRVVLIQVLRGIAASMVVFHHWALALYTYDARPSWIVRSGLGYLGAAGVDLFFVISGFVMLYTTRQRSGLKDAVGFFGKRIKRIYPLYWVWTTVLLLLWISRLALRSHRFTICYLASSYLLLPVRSHLQWHPILDQGWTLSFEMLFYTIFACIIASGFVRMRLCLLLAVFVALPLLGSLLPLDSGIRYLFTDRIIFEFLFGALAAEIALHIQQNKGLIWISHYLSAGLIGAGVFLFVTTLSRHMDTRRWLDYGLPAFLVVLGAAIWKNPPAFRSLVFLGDASYSIYLTHAFMTLAYGMAAKHALALRNAPPDPVIIIGTVITIGVTCLTYPLIEQHVVRSLSGGLFPGRKMMSKRISISKSQYQLSLKK